MTATTSPAVAGASQTRSIVQYQYLLLTGITLLAFALRFYKLGAWSLWIDEVYTIEGARYIADWPLPRLPIYLVLTNIMVSLAGEGEWSVRLMPALVGSLTIPLLFFPVRRIFGTPVAVIAALLLAFAPWHVWWSQNARFYALMLLFYNAGLLWLFISLEERRPWLLGASLILLGLGARERELGLFFVPVLAAYALLLLILPFQKPSWLRPRYLLLLALPAVLFLLYDLYHYSQTGISAVRTWYLLFVGRPIDSPVRILILILFNIGLPVAVLAVFSGGWLTWNRSRPGLYLLTAAVVPVLVLVGLSPFIFTVERYALISLPAWLILAAIGIERLLIWLPREGAWLAAALLLVLLADAAGSHLAYYELNNGNRPDWRGAFAYVASHKGPEDLIVSTRPQIGHYYLGPDQEIIGLRDIAPEQLAAGNKRVWFVVDSQAVWSAPPYKKRWMEENAELLFVRYLRMREQIDMKLYYYDPERPSYGN